MAPKRLDPDVMPDFLDALDVDDERDDADFYIPRWSDQFGPCLPASLTLHDRDAIGYYSSWYKKTSRALHRLESRMLWTGRGDRDMVSRLLNELEKQQTDLRVGLESIRAELSNMTAGAKSGSCEEPSSVRKFELFARTPGTLQFIGEIGKLQDICTFIESLKAEGMLGSVEATNRKREVVEYMEAFSRGLIKLAGIAKYLFG